MMVELSRQEVTQIAYGMTFAAKGAPVETWKKMWGEIADRFWELEKHQQDFCSLLGATEADEEAIARHGLIGE